ncbi:hypothetical protein IAT40_000741 [Kwoniella sp. CBS 6097]
MTTFPTPSHATTVEIPIDPALIDQQSIQNPSPVKVTGSKRKSRGSGAASAGNTNIAGPLTSRVTRRSAASAVPAANTSNGTIRDDNGSMGVSEPARGEEENLNAAYWGTATNKRARRSSPTKRSIPSAPTGRFYPPDRPTLSDAGISAPSTSAISNGDTLHDVDLRYETSIEGFDPNSALAGIEELAAAAMAANDKTANAAYNHASQPYHYPNPSPYPYTYPVGLTPFRYPCLTPDKQPPPPGDPKNPNFRPFDPHAPLTLRASPKINVRSTDPDTSEVHGTDTNPTPLPSGTATAADTPTNTLHAEELDVGQTASEANSTTDENTADSAQSIPTLAAAHQAREAEGFLSKSRMRGQKADNE